ncbi:MAG: ribonuclease H-like domain-containing protein [Candidatus Sumerlaeia bacterium]|nr:ribonuclease H-like domain-containing protein [Candidatus Sumerlaeia bacterium]
MIRLNRKPVPRPAHNGADTLPHAIQAAGRAFQTIAAPLPYDEQDKAITDDERSGLCIEHVAPGRVVERDGGGYWLIERRLSELAPESAAFVRRYAALLSSEAILLAEGTHRRLVEFAECDARRVLYLDIETTGLWGRPLFLIGVMAFDGKDFVLRQYFARNYAEECYLLADFADSLPEARMLVTFNGRAFDLPYVHDRATVNRLAIGWPERHLDLLPESRRRWARFLPNCKLSTLEEHILGRRRVDDIPGAEIPAVYHEFVHTGNAAKIRHVIHHNALDILTMAELTLYMLVGAKDWA